MPREVTYPFQSLSNFRDVGGLETAASGMVRTGVLYRSDELSRLTSDDQRRLQEMGVRLICDLRTAGEAGRKKHPAGLSEAMRVVNIPLLAEEGEMAAYVGSPKKMLGFLFGPTGGQRFLDFSKRCYRHVAFERTSHIREVLTLLADEENLPCLLHCSAGRDRTGFLAALIQLLVGVPYEVVMQDYLLSNDHFEPRLQRFVRMLRVLTLFQVPEGRMRLVLTAHREFLDEVHEGIVRNYGSVEEYLGVACGIEPGTLRRLKRTLLES